MYYEINVALNGRHFFATAKRSITDAAELRDVFKVLDAKFPESEGYHLSISYHSETGFGIGAQSLRTAIQSEGTREIHKLFEPRR